MEETREGGDITAADMIVPDPQPSDIQNFYANSTIFITGTSGFIGKLLLEKLLRSCPDLSKIYILLREKKGKSVEQRCDDIFEAVMFDKLKREQPNFRKKIVVVTGDLEQPYIGLNDAEKALIVNEVNCIFHVAASVRFDEKLKKAAYINVRSVRDLIKMCKQMKQLKSFVYVSTAFSNCPRKFIDEQFYDPPITGKNLMDVIEALDDHYLDGITKTLLSDWPNTYVFTKAIAENIVKTEGQGLPIAVIRPSIVVSTAREPIAGWIDNFYGATGVAYGAAMGLLRSLHCIETNLADLIPADYVVNTAVAAAWDVASIK